MDKNKMTWNEAVEYLRQFNAKNDITTKEDKGPQCFMGVVFTPESFSRVYSLESRTYIMSNHNKAFLPEFLPDMSEYSIFASCKDGTDSNIRLEPFVADEHLGGTWKVDYCYIIEEVF